MEGSIDNRDIPSATGTYAYTPDPPFYNPYHSEALKQSQNAKIKPIRNAKAGLILKDGRPDIRSIGLSRNDERPTTVERQEPILPSPKPNSAMARTTRALSPFVISNKTISRDETVSEVETNARRIKSALKADRTSFPLLDSGKFDLKRLALSSSSSSREVEREEIFTGLEDRRTFPREYTESWEDRVRGLEAEVRELKELLDEKDEKIDMLSRLRSQAIPRASQGRRSSSEEKDSLTLAQSRRETLNMAAQRAFRERKERHVQDLEAKLNLLTTTTSSLQLDNERLKLMLQRAQTENEILRAAAVHPPGFIDDGGSPGADGSLPWLVPASSKQSNNDFDEFLGGTKATNRS